MLHSCINSSPVLRFSGCVQQGAFPHPSGCTSGIIARCISVRNARNDRTHARTHGILIALIAASRFASHRTRTVSPFSEKKPEPSSCQSIKHPIGMCAVCYYYVVLHCLYINTLTRAVVDRTRMHHRRQTKH